MNITDYDILRIFLLSLLYFVASGLYAFWTLHILTNLKFSFVHKHSKQYLDKYYKKYCSSLYTQMVFVCIFYVVLCCIESIYLTTYYAKFINNTSINQNLLIFYNVFNYLMWILIIVGILTFYLLTLLKNKQNQFNNVKDYSVYKDIDFKDFNLSPKVINVINKFLNKLINQKDGFIWKQRFYWFYWYLYFRAAKKLSTRYNVIKVNNKDVILNLDALYSVIEIKMLKINDN